MIRFYLSLLVFTMLTLYLLLVLLFGKVEKHRKRNIYGLPKGNRHYYFVFLNERIRVFGFLIFYLLSALFAAYELYLYYR